MIMNKKHSFIIITFYLLLICSSLIAQDTLQTAVDTLAKPEFALLSPAAVTDVDAKDHPDDAGGEIIISWTLSVDDIADDGSLSKYIVMRSDNPNSGFHIIGIANHQSTSFTDRAVEDGTEYYYKVYSFPVFDSEKLLSAEDMEALYDKYPDVSELSKSDITMLVEYSPDNPMAIFEVGILKSSPVTGPVSSSAQWFNLKDLDTFIIGMIISLSVVVFISLAKGGRKLFLRRIGGLQAIDEAIGRATEMGKSILFIPGIQDMDDVQTVAGITILGRIAKTIAEYDTKINMPVSRSIVMTTARETIKEAYLSAGRPDAYSDDMVHYLTDEQFGYVAAVDGIMVREKPATCFYLGAFFAESLIMAETGNSIGAIQIAGTAMPAQLPFFVAACDYTLIGEELFAASAYLSGEPKQLGSLKGQDVGKVIAMIFIMLGALLATLAVITGNETIISLRDMISSWFSA